MVIWCTCGDVKKACKRTTEVGKKHDCGLQEGCRDSNDCYGILGWGCGGILSQDIRELLSCGICPLLGLASNTVLLLFLLTVSPFCDRLDLMNLLNTFSISHIISHQSSVPGFTCRLTFSIYRDCHFVIISSDTKTYKAFPICNRNHLTY